MKARSTRSTTGRSGPCCRWKRVGQTLNELHGQEVDAARFLDGVDAHDARVVERSERLRLAPETLDALTALRHLGGQDLERHVPAELRVGGAVDLAHPAGADRGGDAVVRESPADHLW